MLKLANQIIDFYDDIYLEGIKKVGSIDTSILVMTPEERAELTDDDYALSIITKKASKLNKFPVDTYDNAYLSNIYFDLNYDRLPKTAALIAAYNLKTACLKHGLSPRPAVEGMAKEAESRGVNSNLYYESEPLHKKASVEEVSLEKIAKVQDIGDNYTHAQYAMPTPASVKVACRYFEDKHDKIPLEYRHKYAAAIQIRAKELGMPAQKGLVSKYASDHYSALLDAHVRSRASLLEAANPDLRAGLDKLASAKKNLTPSQFATALHMFDKKAGLSKYYGGYLTNPYEATFANEPDPYAGYTAKIGSRSITHDEIKVLAHEKYAKIKEYFGQSLADELKKDPVPVFDSLPMDAKQVMVSIANGVA